MRRSLLIAVLVLGVATPTAGASDDWQALLLPDSPVRAGGFTLQVGPGVLTEAKASRDVFVTRAYVQADYRFGLAHGQRTPADIRQLSAATWRFSGSLSWRRGKRRLSVRGLRVATDTRRLSATVSGKRITIGTLGKAWLTSPLVLRRGHGYWPMRSAGPVALSKAFRATMKRRLGRSPQRTVDGEIQLQIPVRIFPD